MRTNVPGCLLISIITVIFSVLGLFLLIISKFIWVLLLLVIPFIYLTKKMNLKEKLDSIQEKEFVAKPGEVYKQCTICGVKAPRQTTVCKNCGNRFE